MKQRKRKNFKCSLCGYKTGTEHGMNAHAINYHRHPDEVAAIPRKDWPYANEMQSDIERGYRTEGEIRAGYIYGIVI